MRQLRISKRITNRDDKSLDRYLNDIGKIGMISVEEEIELAIKIRQGDQFAIGKLTKANLRFVISVAKQYQQQGLTLSDLICEGNIGLLKAALRFDETRGFKFISYAVWWIRQSIVQAIAQNSRIVRLPLNKINIINKMKKANAYFEQENNRSPSYHEIADLIGVSATEVELCIKSSINHTSIDQPISEDSNHNRHELIKSDIFPAPETSLITDSLRIDLDTVLSKLSDRQTEVIRLHYGIGVDSPMTFSEIGQLFGLSTERIRQINESGIRALKRSGRADILIKYLG